MGNLSGHIRQRSATEISGRRLDVSDFDQTMFVTFEQAPELGIYGVGEAYRSAVERTFPDKDALKKYEAEGEHRNRTPLEIANSLAPNRSPEELERLTAELVYAKLSILQGQIGKKLADGTTWPRPVPGFLEYAAARTEGQKVDFGVISAGHASFIRKCLDLYGIQQPLLMITDETTRGLNSRLPPEQLTKPSPFPLALARLLWLNHYDLASIPPESTEDLNKRITFIGDSAEKDGGLAKNAGVQFIHVTPENPAAAWAQMQRSQNMGSVALSGVQ